MAELDIEPINPIEAESPYTLDRAKGVGAWPRSEFLMRAGYQVEILTTPDETRAIVPEWRQLLTESGTQALFQSADWCMAIIDSIDYLGHTEIDVRVVTVRSSGKLVCLLPLMVESRLGLRHARILGEPISQYSEILAAPGYPGVIDRAIAGFIEQEAVDIVRLRHVREDGPLDRAMREWQATVTNSDFAPYLLAGDGRKPKQYLNMERKVRKKIEQGLLHYVHHVGTDCAGHAQAVIDMKQGWLSENRITSRAFSEKLWCEALLRTMSGHSPQFTPLMSEVIIDGQTAAYTAGYVLDGVIFGFLRAYEKQFKPLTPGKVGIVAEMDWAHDNNAERLDLLGPNAIYKQRIAHGNVPIHDYCLLMTGKGRLYNSIVDVRLRQFVKARLDRMPRILRGVAARFS